MVFKYFKGVSTLEELKKAYKQLAKKFHPDLNHDKDTTKIMVDINNEYDSLFQQLKNKADKKEKDIHHDTYNFRDIINSLVKFNSISIDIIGSWIWVYGDTFNIKDQLKDLGLKWSGSNKKWYWTEDQFTKRKKATSYEYKVNKYGRQTIQESKQDKDSKKKSNPRLQPTF